MITKIINAEHEQWSSKRQCNAKTGKRGNRGRGNGLEMEIARIKIAFSQFILQVIMDAIILLPNENCGN